MGNFRFLSISFYIFSVFSTILRCLYKSKKQDYIYHSLAFLYKILLIFLAKVFSS